MWLSELSHLKAISLIMSLDSTSNQLFKTGYKIKPIYTALEFLNLENLKKKKKEVEIMGVEKV